MSNYNTAEGRNPPVTRSSMQHLVVIKDHPHQILNLGINMVNTEQKRVTSAEIYGENNQQGEKKSTELLNTDP